ncbi:hypothetical protein BY996DRAFT_6410754 [Phakopsora pachyrhizi]|nr:hypothetical protein BY996DRAFT_6410754 [Phakopsora pachyrhizi]
MLIPPPSYQDYLYHSPDSSIPQFSEDPQQHHLKNHVHPFLPPEIQSYPHLIEAKTVDKGLKRKKKKKKRSDLLEPIIISANPKEIYPSVQYPLPVKELASLKPVEVLPAITPPIKEAKKYIKYPIEDLELDPLTIIDGRHLRKIGPMSPTSLLPLKPKVSQNAGKKMGRALRIWSFFNIFKFNENGLGLRFDEFECKLDQIIGRLIRALLEESHLRYPNTRHGKGRNFSSMSILPYFSNWPHQETEVMTIEEREYWVRKGIRIINLWKKKADAIAANAGGGLGANVGSESTVIGQKKKINKSSEEDLVINLLDVVCQRGGIERVGCLGRLMKYFFSAEGVYLKIDHDLVDEFQSNVTGLVNNEVEKDDLRNSSRGNIKSATPLNLPEGDLESSDLSDPGSVLGPESESEESEAESGYETPREEQRSFGKSNQRIQLSKMRKILRNRFEQMDYGDKLMLAEFLSDLLMESDHVRNYLEHSDEMLTIVRKEKADVNKEKRRVMEELSKCEPKKDKNSEIGHKTPNGLASEFSPPICPTPQAMSSAGQICSDPPQFFTSTGPKNLQPQTDISVGAESERGEKFEVPLQSAGSEKQIEAPPSPAQLLRQASSASSQLPSPNISINLSGSGTPSQDQFPRLKPITGTILTAKAYSTRVSALTSRQLKSPPVPNWAMEGGYLTEREKLEHQLYEIVLRELELNERFRQYAGVSKTRMLGYDRFYCRYWWFDGIGGMNFYSNDQEQINDGEGEECVGGSSLRSYSGGIFVCGPSIEDLTRIEGLYGGKLALWKRRLKEEYGVEENEDEAEVKKWVLSVDEWGIYDQEEQIEGLMSWLNSKGNREMNLKQNLKDWKEYILDGIRGCKRDRQEEHDGSRLSSSSNQDGKNI